MHLCRSRQYRRQVTVTDHIRFAAILSPRPLHEHPQQGKLSQLQLHDVINKGGLTEESCS